MNEQERKNAWLSFMASAIAGNAANPEVDDDEIVNAAEDIADAALKIYEKKFKKRGSRSRKDEEEDE